MAASALHQTRRDYAGRALRGARGGICAHTSTDGELVEERAGRRMGMQAGRWVGWGEEGCSQTTAQAGGCAATSRREHPPRSPPAGRGRAGSSPVTSSLRHPVGGHQSSDRRVEVAVGEMAAGKRGGRTNGSMRHRASPPPKRGCPLSPFRHASTTPASVERAAGAAGTDAATRAARSPAFPTRRLPKGCRLPTARSGQMVGTAPPPSTKTNSKESLKKWTAITTQKKKPCRRLRRGDACVCGAANQRFLLSPRPSSSAQPNLYRPSQARLRTSCWRQMPVPPPHPPSPPASHHPLAKALSTKC